VWKVGCEKVLQVCNGRTAPENSDELHTPEKSCEHAKNLQKVLCALHGDQLIICPQTPSIYTRVSGILQVQHSHVAAARIE
jgi:hypothetical protein